MATLIQHPQIPVETRPTAQWPFCPASKNYSKTFLPSKPWGLLWSYWSTNNAYRCFQSRNSNSHAESHGPCSFCVLTFSFLQSFVLYVLVSNVLWWPQTFDLHTSTFQELKLWTHDSMLSLFEVGNWTPCFMCVRQAIVSSERWRTHLGGLNNVLHTWKSSSKDTVRLRNYYTWPLNYMHGP